MDAYHRRQVFCSLGGRERMKGAGMKRFFKIISGMGFTTMLIGLGMMDSASVVLPIAMIFAGIGAFYLGMRMVDEYA